MKLKAKYVVEDDYGRDINVGDSISITIETYKSEEYVGIVTDMDKYMISFKTNTDRRRTEYGLIKNIKKIN